MLISTLTDNVPLTAVSALAQAAERHVHSPHLMEYEILPNFVRLTLNGPFDADSSRRLLTTLRALSEVCDFDVVELCITSNGGSVNDMHICLGAIAGMRRDLNVRFKTVGISAVGSAAANLLAFGDLGSRSAVAGSIVLFHNARIQFQGASLTAISTRSILQTLEAADSRVHELLATHIAPCFEVDADVFEFPRQTVTEERFARVAKKRRVQGRKKFEKYLKSVLNRIFEFDAPMSVQTAIAFGLCDVERSHLIEHDLCV